MDTTWRVLPYYVTSILMCSVCNVGIPLAFSFGKGETVSLYEMFFKAFADKFGIDLGTFTVESDNGVALTTVCSNHNNKHLKCLKHFLTSLGLEEFSKQVGELVSAKCIKDFDALCKIYVDQFSRVPSEKVANLTKTLSKAGLAFCPEKKEIIIADFTKWETISQIERIKYAMPSTTNALESSHGHLNARIPRRNNYWSAMLRLVMYVMNKENNFSEALQRNYQREKRVVMKTFKENSSLIEQQIHYYNTTESKCECGETTLLSKMFRVNIACSHIYSITKKFEELPDIELTMSKNINELEIEHVIIDLPEVFVDLELQNKIQNKATKTIRRFSHFKQEKLIRDDVSSLKINDEFANGLPTSYHKVVSNGIQKFFVKKNKGTDSGKNGINCSNQCFPTLITKETTSTTNESTLTTNESTLTTKETTSTTNESTLTINESTSNNENKQPQ